MLDDGLPLFGPKIDLYQVEPITPRRTLTFVNHFISQTANFFNKFATTCEERLEEVGLRIQRMEILMTILETKIASIPGLENVTIETNREETPKEEVEVVSKTEIGQATPTAVSVSDGNGVHGGRPEGGDVGEGRMVANRNHPTYKKYFSMMSMGVPAPAIKQKMVLEGIDPSVLDNPSGLSHGPSADDESKTKSEDSNSSIDSDSSFDD